MTSKDARAQWDERYGVAGYAYGDEPNDFLREVAGRLPPGPVLSLAEGEGRNAIFLAERGHAVTAVDFSQVGLAKANERAAARALTLTTVLADMTEYEIAPGAWSAIVMIWCHLHRQARPRLVRACAEGLAPGGMLVIEAYTPRQLDHRTGGPPTAELMVEPEELRDELAGLELLVLGEEVREIHEGRLHDGPSAVVRALARRPTS